MALSWPPLERSRPTPGSERSLCSAMCRTHTDLPVTQVGMVTGHLNSLFARRLITGNTITNQDYAFQRWDKNFMRGRLFALFCTSKTQGRVDLGFFFLTTFHRSVPSHCSITDYRPQILGSRREAQARWWLSLQHQVLE